MCLDASHVRSDKVPSPLQACGAWPGESIHHRTSRLHLCGYLEPWSQDLGREGASRQPGPPHLEHEVVIQNGWRILGGYGWRRCRIGKLGTPDRRMFRQIAEPEMPELVVELAPAGGIAVLIQRFQITEDLCSPLATDGQTLIIRPHSY